MSFPRFLISLLTAAVFIPCSLIHAQDSLMRQGWAALVQDKDAEAIQYFSRAYDAAVIRKDSIVQANALLHLGICAYGSSFSNGMAYANKALALYHNLEKDHKAVALEGRSRCLELVGTISGRQGRYTEAIALCKQAIEGLVPENDTTGTLGLAYTSLGNLYERLHKQDSADLFFKKALEENLKTKNVAYLPGAYMNVGAIALREHNKDLSYRYFTKAAELADSSNNKQSKAGALLALAGWYRDMAHDPVMAERICLEARAIGITLKDKVFFLKALDLMVVLKKEQRDYQAALNYLEEKNQVSDTIFTRDKDKLTKSLEAQFRVAEKERELELLRREQAISRLTNYMLGGGIFLLLIIAGGSIWLLRRINRRDRQLLRTREELSLSREREQELHERHMQHEIAFKESQMSALTLQMLQKNELLLELKEKLERNAGSGAMDKSIEKIVNQGLNRDKEWADFNLYFESINKHFYSRLRQQFPEISPNDLKICALIRLNLSSKDMANILNISPDSVKTARYRLRKKLQLNTEDNLTEFILNL